MLQGALYVRQLFTRWFKTPTGQTIMNVPLRWIAVSLLVAGSSALGQDAPESVSSISVFEPPTRLKADGKVIDTGDANGHCGPTIVDLDGDGLNDLVVGDFSGKFHFYRNVGTATTPAYESSGLLKAGDKDAEVRIYCCIGSQARFCDIDGDGIRDLISNSYDPGCCYLFRGRPGVEFAPREELRDKSGIPVRSAPVLKQDHQAYGSFYAPIDWDADGDFDLLIGCFDGGLKLRMNEGSAKHPAFATDNRVVEAAGKPMKVDAHFCPVCVDWDGDGQWDLVTGSEHGGVTWFRNVGSTSVPVFDPAQILVEKPADHGGGRLVESDADVRPGIRTQVEVTDFDGDGKLDLLVGDFYSSYDLKRDLSDSQRQTAKQMVAEFEPYNARFRAQLVALDVEFRQRFPGEDLFSDKADQEWSKAYKAIREGVVAKKREAREPEFVKKLRPFLAATDGPRDRTFDLLKSHGHVWLYLRK